MEDERILEPKLRNRKVIIEFGDRNNPRRIQLSYWHFVSISSALNAINVFHFCLTTIDHNIYLPHLFMLLIFQFNSLQNPHA